MGREGDREKTIRARNRVLVAVLVALVALCVRIVADSLVSDKGKSAVSSSRKGSPAFGWSPG
jgi:hypothetical protein